MDLNPTRTTRGYFLCKKGKARLLEFTHGIEDGVIRITDRGGSVFYILVQFGGRRRMHHGIESIRETFESRSVVAMGNVGLLCEDRATFHIQLPTVDYFKADHRIIREAGVLMTENSTETAHSLLSKVVAEFFTGDTPVLERGQRVRDVGTGNADAGAVGIRQNAGRRLLRYIAFRSQ